MIITIDGPVGTGKSTIAKLFAEKLGFVHFDTGAMYRCVTYGVLKNKVNPNHAEELESLLKNLDFEIKIIEGEKRYFFEGEDITKKIREEAVTSKVSEISAKTSVREKLVELQRRLGEGVNAVFEGRDMGTIVFPKAEIKIFLTAKPEVRAQRRYDELKEKFPKDSKNLDFNELLNSINNRDAYDSTRKVSPLKQAEDAYVVDTSDLTIDQVLEKLIFIKNTYLNKLKY